METWQDAKVNMDFEIVGSINDVETFAAGRGIRDLQRLRKSYGVGFWRKCKGTAVIRYSNGMQHLAELHWYEANGIGRREMKVKRVLRSL